MPWRGILLSTVLALFSNCSLASDYAGAGVPELPLQKIMGRLMWTEVSLARDAARGGKRYDVCPSCKRRELDQVPWSRLQPGDVVNIFHRPEPYRHKLMLTVHGTQKRPIVINGVSDAAGNRPTLDFRNSTNVNTANAKEWGTSKWPLDVYGGIALTYNRDLPNGGRYGDSPEWIEIRNLRLVGAVGGATFIRADGSKGEFIKGANAIWAQMARHITVEGCVIEDNGQGVFVNFAGKDTISSDWTLRGNFISNNGVVNSWLQHNLYIQSGGKNLYEWNFVGQVRQGALGGSLKDRSSGVIIRNNVIVSSARMIDLVETQGGQEIMLATEQSTREYRDAHVYNNFLYNDRDARGAVAPIHYGYDTGSNHPTDPQLFSGTGVSANKELPRNGTLYFFNNTYMFDGGGAYRSYLFDLGGAGDNHGHYPGQVNYRNNVLVTQGKSRVAWLRTEGKIVVEAENVHQGPALFADHGSADGKAPTVQIIGEDSIRKTDPMLDDGYRLKDSSPARELPALLPPELQGLLAPKVIGAEFNLD